MADDQNMADDATELILIVAGSTLRAEQMDRPLAYFLQTQIEQRSQKYECPPPLVICDARWLHEQELQRMPTICVGGPGVNMLSQKWLDDLPSVMVMEDKFIVQMDLKNSPRACIWGMNNPLTKLAIVTFAEQFLLRFLGACAARVVERDARRREGEP